MFGIYIVVNGDLSPGGGFQGGLCSHPHLYSFILSEK
ncbi:MnhB domain-containing protein [Fusibacter sp. JL216-2]